jgi:DNA-directed RNA polymerase specialized sigma24 family protein
MSHDSESAVDAALIGERRHLLSLAFQMLGTVVEAEDAVQETYVRWYRMDQAERDQVSTAARDGRARSAHSR